MKLIASLAGTVALQVSTDDVGPRNGLLQHDLIQYIGNRYHFSNRPNIPPNLPPNTQVSIVFHNGENDGEGWNGISDNPNRPTDKRGYCYGGQYRYSQLYSRRSDRGARVGDLKFEYRGKPQRKTYISVLIVEFEEALDLSIAPLKRVEFNLSTPEEAMPREGAPFKNKGFIFGYGDPVEGMTFSDAAGLEQSDFIFQRRAGAPYDQNLILQPNASADQAAF